VCVPSASTTSIIPAAIECVTRVRVGWVLPADDSLEPNGRAASPFQGDRGDRRP